MPLESLLMTIIQRPSRLLMLIRDILKNTEENHIDFEGLKGQQDVYEKRNDEINECIREYDAVKLLDFFAFVTYGISKIRALELIGASSNLPLPFIFDHLKCRRKLFFKKTE